MLAFEKTVFLWLNGSWIGYMMIEQQVGSLYCWKSWMETFAYKFEQFLRIFEVRWNEACKWDFWLKKITGIVD